MTAHAETNLRDYVRVAVRELKPDIRPHNYRMLVNSIDAFCDWVGEDISAADATPEMVAEFEEATNSKWRASRVLTVLRTYDPIRFRIRHPGAGWNRRALDRGGGSQFLLANLYLDHYEPRALRTRRPNTKRLYKTTLIMFDKFLGRSATIDDLTDEKVGRFAAWRVDNGLSKRSVNKDLFNLLALWRWAHRKGLVDEWPDVELEKPPRRTPVAWSEAEIRKLYATMGELPGRVGSIRACDWWQALLLVAWNTGERINAIMHLEWADVDTKRKWLRFAAEFRKGGRDDNSMRLSAETIAALRKLPKESELVFPWPYSPTYLWHEFGRILQASGLPSDSRCKFHRIRRTVASHAEAAGANATAMLRHTKREITEAYLDPRICTPQQPVDVLFRLTATT
jgi:integrase